MPQGSKLRNLQTLTNANYDRFPLICNLRTCLVKRDPQGYKGLSVLCPSLSLFHSHSHTLDPSVRLSMCVCLRLFASVRLSLCFLVCLCQKGVDLCERAVTLDDIICPASFFQLICKMFTFLSNSCIFYPVHCRNA